MFTIFESNGNTYRMLAQTGETWRLNFDKWVRVPEYDSKPLPAHNAPKPVERTPEHADEI